MSTTINTYIHPLTNPSPLTNLLHSLLPYPIPLLRRLQHPNGHSPTAFLLATFPSPTDPTTPPRPSGAFAVGHFDRATAPAIQGWVFSSLELAPKSTDNTSDTEAGRETREEEGIRCILAILARFRALSPPSHPRSHDYRRSETQTTPTQPTDSSDIIVIGSLHTHPATLLRTHPSAIIRDDILGPGGPYTKYLIPHPPTSPSHPPPALPKGLHHTTVTTSSDFACVLANNPFVRSAASLQGLANAGVRVDATGDLVAFAYLGLEGSVRTLHVEPGFRRLGLGRQVVGRLLEGEFARQRGEGEGVGLVHTDVARENLASVRLFEGLRARAAWESFWVRVDLDRVVRWLEAHDDLEADGSG